MKRPCACPECDQLADVTGVGEPIYCSQVCYDLHYWVKLYGYRVRCLCRRYPWLRRTGYHWQRIFQLWKAKGRPPVKS